MPGSELANVPSKDVTFQGKREYAAGIVTVRTVVEDPENDTINDIEVLGIWRIGSFITGTGVLRRPLRVRWRRLTMIKMLIIT